MSNSIWQDLQENIDLATLVQSFGIQLESKSHKYVGLCPFHREKTPSFMIYPETNSWCCFGCNKSTGNRNGGGVVEFLKQKLDMPPNQVIHWIKQQYPSLHLQRSIELPTIDVSKPDIAIVNQDIIEYYANLLWFENKEDWFINRGFTKQTILTEMFGWDGDSYIIPIWSGTPGKSPVYAYKKRTFNQYLPKYIKWGDYSKALIYGLYNLNFSIVFMFAGELDAALAKQNGLPAVSIVDGKSGKFPDNWPDLYFPNQKYLYLVFDSKEASQAAYYADQWDQIKGYSSTVFHWPTFEGDDYTDYVLLHSHQNFMNLASIYLPQLQELLKCEY